ncbi:MAG: SDR family oxidoreductase [Lewinella sp.]|uniref:SDR family oxidoreductase n=1 Tax=Lewinella sp. TaxID=2004506 RepID=UPI003D6AA599
MNYLVTGASQGIGFATALALASQPDDQVFALSRNSKGLALLADTARDQYGHANVEVMAADLRNVDVTDIAEWIKPFGHLHGLVNNAGLLLKASFLDSTATTWQQTFDVNFFAVVRLLQGLHPIMKNTHILNIGSMGGYQGSSKFPGLIAYSASKAALANLTECLAEEWSADNIRCNCLAPGAVQTEMLATAFPGFEAPVSSEKMGEMVAWFLREGHHFFNGKVLPVSVSTP